MWKSHQRIWMIEGLISQSLIACVQSKNFISYLFIEEKIPLEKFFR